MKSRLAFGIALTISYNILLIHPQADAAVYYWDSNDTTSTLGDVGSSVWGYGANLANLTLAPSGIWDGTLTVSTIVTGIDTTSSDSIYFGTNSLSLGPIASEIAIAEGGVSIGTIVFGTAQSDPIILSGSGGTITVSTIIVNNSSDTIDAVLDGSLGIIKSGPGTLVLTGDNTFIGGVTLSSGTLQIGNGTTGSLAPNQALNFLSGGGFFNVMGAAGGSTQVMGAPNFFGGDATIQSTYGGSGTTILSFDSLAAPSAGATGNFVTSGGVNGSTNLITFNGGLSTDILLDTGLFFNGSSYAAYDAGGFMRAYGVGDSGYASTNTTIVNDYNQNVQLTGNITGQGSAATNTINLGAYSITMAGASTLQADGLLSSGSSSATIGGGTTPGLQTASAGGEMVIRVNGSSDQLAISSAILDNDGSFLTKSGAGTLILSGANTYTGVTTINSGVLAVSGGNAIANSASVILADSAGAEFRLNNNETIDALLGGGFSGGNVNVQSNTLTISNAYDFTFGGLFTGTSGGGVTLSSGTLTLSNKNAFAGTITLQGTSQLTLSYGNDGTDSAALVSSGGTISMAGGTTLLVNPTAQVAGGAVGGAQGGEGVIVSNAINVSSGTATIKHGAGGDAKYVFSGGVTGGISGNQTLSIVQGASGGNGERTNILFSGVMQDGAGTLGVNVDFTGASSTNQGAVVNLSGQNTFTGPIVVNNTKGLTYSGASAYQGGWLTIGGESSYSGPTTRVATEGNGYLGGGNYTGSITLAGGTVLDYLSSADQILAGAISGGGNLVKEGSGTLSLSGTNNYTGTTSVVTGVLRITGNSSGATGAVAVTGGALGGSGGSLGGAVTISGTGGTDLRDGSVGNLTLGSSLAITGVLGANSMIFDLGNATNTTDKIIVAGATSVTTAGSAVITLNQIGGAAGRNTAGTYTLIQGGGSMAAVGQFALATTKAFGQTFALGVSGNNLNLTTTQVTGAAASNTTLSGASPSWASAGNFSGGAVPDYMSNVIINSAIGTSALNGSTDINSLTFGASATTGVSITSGTASAGTNASMLVIEASGANGNTPGNGITLSNTSGSHTISANIGLAASQSWTLASGSSLTTSGVVSDFGGGYSLTKAGGGTLTLSGANTYSGGTFITAGTLKIGNATALGRNSGAVSVTGGASLDLNGITMTGTNALTLNGTGISNGGALTNTSATGATYAGLLTLGSASSIMAASGNIILSNPGTITGAGNALTIGGAFNTSIAGIIGTTGGALIKQDAGTLTLSGASIYTGVTTINGGVLQIGNGVKTGSLTGTSSIVINSGGNLTINRSGIFNQDGDLGANVAITGLGSFTQAGSGTIILSALNTYSGATNINAGTLSLTGTIGSGTGTNITINGSSLLSQTSTGAISGASSLTHNSSATSILSGTNTYTGVTTISTGTLQFAKQVSLYNNNAAGAWSATNIKVASGATFAINVGGTGEFTAGNVTTLLTNLGGINGTSTTGFAAGSTMAFDTTNAIGESFTMANSFANSSGFGGGAIGLLKLGTYTLALTGANTYNGATTIKSGVLQLGDGGSTGTLSIDSQITNNAILAINRSNDVTQGTDFSNRAIIGSGAFIQAGTGNTTLNASNTFTGSTTVSAGTLTLAHALALRNSTLVTSGAGNLALNGITTFTLGGLKGSGNLTTIFDASYSNAVNLTLNPSSNVTYVGAIAEGAAGMTLTKTGSGTQVLAGANTYTGTTIIYNGTLQIGNSFTGSLNGTTGTALIMNGGTFNLQEAGYSVQGMGALSFGAGESTILSTAYDTWQSQTLSFASLNARNAGATANFNIANNTTVTANKIVFVSTTNTPVNNSGSNDQGIFFAGNDYARYDTTAGYLRAVNYGTDTNAYAVNGGGISLGVSDATKDLKISGDITSQGSAVMNTLNLANRSLTLSNSSQVLSTNGILATNNSTIATAGFLQSATAGGELVIRVVTNTLTVNPIIRNNTSASSLTKSGGGTLVLSNSPTYTGTTTVNAGTLQITPGTLNVFGSTAGISLGKGASLFLALGSVSGASAGTSGAGGYTIANPITLTGTGSSILTSQNQAKWNFSGNITSAVAGDVTLNIRNNQGGGGGDRTDMLFSGVISNGSSSALGLSFAISPQSGSATYDHPAYANLTGLNTFTGNITLTRPNAGSTSWLVIGGERWSDGPNNTPSYGRQGSGRLADDLGGVYAGNFNLSNTSTNIVNLDYFSSANQTWSGVIGGGSNNVGSLIKEGSGTLTLTNANTYNGLTTVGGGTLLLGYTSTTTNILSSATRLWMGLGTTYQPGSVAMTISGGGGGGTLQLGGSAGSATQTLASLNTSANTANRILMGANRLLTFTSPTITIGANSGLNFNTAAGGANGATVGTSVVAFGGVPTTFTNGFTVTDAGGFGLATINGSNQVIRNTSTVALPGSGGSSPTNYLTTSSTGNSVTSSQSAGSITTDTTGGSVTLALGAGVTLSNNVWNFGGIGSNTAQVTGGTGVNSVASGNAIVINNYNSGTVTFNSPILANGSNAVIVGGTGTVSLAGANTFSGGAVTINSGNLQISGTGSLNGGTFSSNFGISGSSVLQYSSSINQILSGIISGPGGITKDTNSSTLTLSGNNTYTGVTTISAGILQVGNGATTGSIFGTTTVINNATLNFNRTDSYGGSFTPIISGSGALNLMAGTLTLTGANTYTGATSINAGTLAINSTNSLGDGSATNTLIFNGGTLQAVGTITSQSTRSVTMTSTGTIDTNSQSVSIAGNIGSTGGLNKNGAGTLTLSGTNSYGGVTTVNVGTLQFARQTSLYNNNTGNWTSTNINVKGGGTLALNVGGTGEFTAGNLTTLLTNLASSSSSTNGMLAGSNFGFDTTNASGGTFTINDVIADSIGASGGARGVIKLGTAALVLSNSSSYTGVTIINSGTLSVSSLADGGYNSNIGSSLNAAGNLVLNGGTLQYTGTALSTDRLFSLQSSSTLDSSGSGAISFTNTGSMGFNGGAAAKTLTLTGSNTGSNTIAAVIGDNTGATSVAKSGAGNWALSGANTYSGATTVSGGTLTLTNALALQNSALTLSGGTVALSGITTLTVGGLNGSTNLSSITNYGSVTALTLNPQSGNTAVYSGVVSNGSGAMTLIKTGVGTQILAGANSYTGATIVKQGTLQIGNFTSGSLTNGNPLTFAGTGTFNVAEAAGVSQTMGALTFSAGDGTVTSTWNQGSGNTALTFASMTRAAGATGNFTFAGAGSSAANNRIILTSSAGAPLTTGSNNQGIFFGGNNYARYNTSTNTFAAVVYGTNSNATTVNGGATIGSTTAISDILLSGAITGQTTTSVNTIKTGFAIAQTGGSTLSVNGILTTANVAIGTVGNSLRTTGAGGEMVINTTTGTTTVAANIIDNGTSRLTKAGAGTLTLSGTNAYAGGTSINAGILQATKSSALGTGSVSVIAGAQLFINANSLTIANNITLNGTTTNGAIYSGNLAAGNVTNLSGQITLNATSNISHWWNDKTLQLSGKITGAGGLDFVLQPGSVGGRYYITGATNDYTGATSVTGSATSLGGYTGQAMLYLGATNALTTTTALTLNYADLYLNGQSQTLASISGSGNFSVQNGSTTAASLTLGAGNTSSTFSGSLKDNGISVTNTSTTPANVTGTVSLTKIGTGTLTLAAANTHSGLTTISQGILRITNASALGTTAGATSITSGATLDLFGQTIAENISSIDGTGMGNNGALINSNTNTAAAITGGIVMQSDSSIGGTGNLNVSGVISGSGMALTKTGGGTLTLTGANTYTGTTTVSSGSLVINGAVASTSLVVNGSLSGSGTIANAIISGSGSINPGNSPGILTGLASNPTSGLDYNFEFTAANAPPVWNNPTSSLNDVLRLTDSSAPITASMNSTNLVSIFLNVGSIASGNVFTGGFYTDKTASFLAAISGASFQYYIADPVGAVEYNGNKYGLYSGPLGFKVDTVQQTANFGSGNISGTTTQFTVGDPLLLYSLWAGGGGAFGNDYNGDGVSNGLAWLLGVANPTVNARPYLPVPAVSSGNIHLYFNTLNKASRGAASIKVQYSNDLGVNDSWTTHQAEVPDASGTVNNIVFTITPSGNYLIVDALIPASAAGTGKKLFTRVSATLP